jgi:hypothetical protein
MFSQNIGDDTYFNDDDKDKGEVTVVKKPAKGFDPKVNLSVGSYFSSYGFGYNTFGTYVMPEITLPVNKNFAVRAGFGYTSLFTNYGSEGSVFNNSPQHYGTVYVEGIYKVNEKITVSAAGYKTFNLQPLPQKEKINPRALDMSNEGVNVNINYKVNDRFQINAGFSYDKGYYNPYNMFGTPGIMNGGFNNPALRGSKPFYRGF